MKQFTEGEAKEAEEILNDVLWWFRGWVNAQPPERIINIPDMDRLSKLYRNFQQEDN